MVFDDQCDVTWEVPSGVEPILLYQTTSYNIEKDSLDLIGGSDGRTFNFCVGLGLAIRMTIFISSHVTLSFSLSLSLSRTHTHRLRPMMKMEMVMSFV